MISETLKMLANDQRRDVISLVSEQKEVTIEQIADSTEERIELIHATLPKLEDHEVIDRDDEAIRAGEEFDRHAEMLERIKERT